MAIRSMVFQTLIGMGLLCLWAKPVLAYEGRFDAPSETIYNNQDARVKCQKAMEQWHQHNTQYDVRWTGQWMHNSSGNGAVCGVRYIKRDDWKAKSIADRSINTAEKIAGCSDKAHSNGWINDDMCRDKLVMDADKVGWVTVMSKEALATLKSARYIFVLRKTTGDNSLVLRRYDRSHNVGSDICDNSAYLYSGNKATIKNKNNQHVRHSQVNSNKGGANPWREVWSAGELWIKGGKIVAITNESGHFMPSKESLRYVMETLNFLSIPTQDDVLFDFSSDAAKISSLKNQCLGGRLIRTEL